MWLLLCSTKIRGFTVFVTQEHDSGVLTAYVLLLFFPFWREHYFSRGRTKQCNSCLQTSFIGTFWLFLGGFLPGWLNLIFDPNFGWKSFTTAVLDGLVHKSKKALKMFDNKRGTDYMKATHLQKKSWISFIRVSCKFKTCQLFGLRAVLILSRRPQYIKNA